MPQHPSTPLVVPLRPKDLLGFCQHTWKYGTVYVSIRNIYSKIQIKEYSLFVHILFNNCFHYFNFVSGIKCKFFSKYDWIEKYIFTNKSISEVHKQLKFKKRFKFYKIVNE